MDDGGSHRDVAGAGELCAPRSGFSGHRIILLIKRGWGVCRGVTTAGSVSPNPAVRTRGEGDHRRECMRMQSGAGSISWTSTMSQLAPCLGRVIQRHDIDSPKTQSGAAGIGVPKLESTRFYGLYALSPLWIYTAPCRTMQQTQNCLETQDIPTPRPPIHTHRPPCRNQLVLETCFLGCETMRDMVYPTPRS